MVVERLGKGVKINGLWFEFKDVDWNCDWFEWCSKAELIAAIWRGPNIN